MSRYKPFLIELYSYTVYLMNLSLYARFKILITSYILSFYNNKTIRIKYL